MLELRIVLDTSAIHTESEGYLLAMEIGALAKNQRGDPNLNLRWYLPDVVVQERQFQIQQRAVKLFQNVADLEKVIGRSLDVTERQIRELVSQRVNEQIREYGLSVSQLAHDQVNWPLMIERAISRQPPFDVKPSVEKGFRDALILETFMQLVESSPADRTQCRLVFVTKDELLTTAVTQRTTTKTNVHILKSTDEVKGFISTLLSTVSEDLVKAWQATAKEYFGIRKEEGKGVFYPFKVDERIKSDFKEDLAALPDGANRRENEWKWLIIGAPRFVKKQHDRVWWASKVKIRATAFANTSYRYVVDSPAEMFLPSAAVVSGSAIVPADFPQSVSPNYGSEGRPFSSGMTVAPAIRPFSSGMVVEPLWNPGNVPEGSAITSSGAIVPGYLLNPERVFAEGDTAFAVNWSVAVNAQGEFREPRLESVEFVETTWAIKRL